MSDEPQATECPHCGTPYTFPDWASSAVHQCQCVYQANLSIGELLDLTHRLELLESVVFGEGTSRRRGPGDGDSIQLLDGLGNRHRMQVPDDADTHFDPIEDDDE